MSLEEALTTLVDAGGVEPSLPIAAVRHPAGWEPGVAWDGEAGTLTTQPLTAAPGDWAELLAVWDLDPQEYEVVEPVQYRAWDAAVGGGEVRRMYYYKAVIRRRRAASGAVADVLAALGRRRPKKPEPTQGAHVAFVLAAGDLQLGKPDGDGSAGTVDRFTAKVDAARARLKELRRAGRRIGSIVLPWLGDCIEGLYSQGGALAAAGRLDLSITEQLRVYRRLMAWEIEQFADLSDRVIVPVVPGNHDEAYRVGKIVRSYTDSWAVEGAVAVADGLKMSGRYDHVSFVFPARDELTVTLAVGDPDSPTIMGFAHGHQFGRDPMKWWAGQAHGQQPIGSATLLLGAHLHHLRVEQSGAKTFMQVPALDGGSQWWKHRTGQDSPPGMLSMLVGDGVWSDLAVL